MNLFFFAKYFDSTVSPQIGTDLQNVNRAKI